MKVVQPFKKKRRLSIIVDWQLGEKYFADKLLDFDLAANNGGWQWWASVGVDAQLYFRVINPSLQSERFDSDAEFIKKWIPDLANCKAKDIHNPLHSDLFRRFNYPKHIVNHDIQKRRAILLFNAANTLEFKPTNRV